MSKTALLSAGALLTGVHGHLPANLRSGEVQPYTQAQAVVIAPTTFKHQANIFGLTTRLNTGVEWNIAEFWFKGAVVAGNTLGQTNQLNTASGGGFRYADPSRDKAVAVFLTLVSFDGTVLSNDDPEHLAIRRYWNIVKNPAWRGRATMMVLSFWCDDRVLPKTAWPTTNATATVTLSVPGHDPYFTRDDLINARVVDSVGNVWPQTAIPTQVPAANRYSVWYRTNTLTDGGGKDQRNALLAAGLTSTVRLNQSWKWSLA